MPRLSRGGITSAAHLRHARVNDSTAREGHARAGPGAVRCSGVLASLGFIHFEQTSPLTFSQTWRHPLTPQRDYCAGVSELLKYLVARTAQVLAQCPDRSHWLHRRT